MLHYKDLQRKSQPTEQDDYSFLQPMFQKHPPNQLISRRYAPDVTPQVRLITNKDQRNKNINFVPPKNRSVQLSEYANKFDSFDYLGKHYSDKINQLVFRKFDNSNNCTIPSNKLKYNLLSALYIPFQQLHNSTFINTSSLSNNNAGNRGCSFDPLFNSDYQCGNLFAAFRKSPFEYDLILQSDSNSQQAGGWFNFSVQFTTEGYYSFKIVNITADLSKLFEAGMKISCLQSNNQLPKNNKRNGEGWDLCGQNIKFSQSIINRQTQKGDKYYQLYFQYKCKNKHDTVIFAMQTPYSTTDFDLFSNRVIQKKNRSMITLTKKQYGQTIIGTPLSAYLISRKKARGDSTQLISPISQAALHGMQKRKSINLTPITSKFLLQDCRNRSIVVIGRMHGQNVSSSYIIEGMIEYLLESPQFDSLKRNINFYFVPLANIDGVRVGNSCVNLTGSNLSGCWKTAHNIFQAEIHSLKDFLTQINKQFPISLVLNLTSSQNNIYSSVVGVKTDPEECEDSRIFPFILSKRNKLFSFQHCVFLKPNQNNSMCCVLAQLLPKALLYELNVSHFQSSGKAQYPESFRADESSIKQCNPEGYRTFGKQIISNYLQHVKLYQKNSLLKDKWMKEIEQQNCQSGIKQYHFIESLKTEERFPQSFYKINQLYKNQPSNEHLVHILQSKQPKGTGTLSCTLINPKKKFDITMPKIKKQTNTQPSIDNQSNKHSEIYLKSNTQLTHSPQILHNFENNIETQPQMRTFSFCRGTDKKTSILRNLPANTLSLECQIKKQKLNIQKEQLKKELSNKMLKKIKIQDTMRNKLGRKIMGQILSHS